MSSCSSPSSLKSSSHRHECQPRRATARRNGSRRIRTVSGHWAAGGVDEDYAGGARAGTGWSASRRAWHSACVATLADGSNRGRGCAASVSKTRRDRSQWQMPQCCAEPSGDAARMLEPLSGAPPNASHASSFASPCSAAGSATPNVRKTMSRPAGTPNERRSVRSMQSEGTTAGVVPGSTCQVPGRVPRSR